MVICSGVYQSCGGVYQSSTGASSVRPFLRNDGSRCKDAFPFLSLPLSVTILYSLILVKPVIILYFVFPFQFIHRIISHWLPSLFWIPTEIRSSIRSYFFILMVLIYTAGKRTEFHCDVRLKIKNLSEVLQKNLR